MHDKHYITLKLSDSCGRTDSQTDASCFRWHQIIKKIDLLHEDLAQAFQSPSVNSVYVILGFASDEGVRRNLGRVGSAAGPQAIRHALSNLPVHFGGDVIIYDAGDVVCRDGDLEGSQESLAHKVQLIKKHNAIPIILGGGHEVAFGHGLGLLQSMAATDQSKKLGIINFDAHFDLRPLMKKNDGMSDQDHHGTSGTPFLQLSQASTDLKQPFNYFCLGIQQSANTQNLFNTAKKLDVGYIQAAAMLSDSAEAGRAELAKYLDHVDNVYLTICLDAFDCAYAPGVSAPATNGLSPTVFFAWFKQILNSKKIISLDLAELNPSLDRDAQTARLAARIIFEFIQHT